MSEDLQFPPVKYGARIGILGGSFDPPHLCHQLLALSFLTLDAIDELWIIPCADHAFKNSLTSFAHRFAMCERAFARLKNVRVLDVESKLKAPSYTIETVNVIKTHRPDIELLLCLGSDLIDSFHQWHRAEDLVKKVSVAIFERQSYAIGDLPDLLKSAHIHRGYALPDTNSTGIREFLKNQNRNTQCNFLDRDVLSYVEKHRLYDSGLRK